MVHACLSVPLAQARGVKFRPSLVIQAATDTVTPGVPCHITLLCAPRYLQSPYFILFSSYHLILSLANVSRTSARIPFGLL